MNLTAAVEHLQTTRALLDAPNDTMANQFPLAHRTLVRISAVGGWRLAVAQAIWLLVPNAREIRLARQCTVRATKRSGGSQVSFSSDVGADHYDTKTLEPTRLAATFPRAPGRLSYSFLAQPCYASSWKTRWLRRSPGHLTPTP